MGVGFYIMCLYVKEEFGHKPLFDLKMKTKIGVMILQAMECLRWPTNHQKLKRGIEQILSLSPHKESMLLIP